MKKLLLLLLKNKRVLALPLLALMFSCSSDDVAKDIQPIQEVPTREFHVATNAPTNQVRFYVNGKEEQLPQGNDQVGDDIMVKEGDIIEFVSNQSVNEFRYVHFMMLNKEATQYGTVAMNQGTGNLSLTYTIDKEDFDF